nr:MAG TPA: nuclease [Caudoviricetes sp.]
MPKTAADFLTNSKLKTGVSFLSDDERNSLISRQTAAYEAAQVAAEREQNQGGFLGGIGYAFEKIGLGFLSGIEGIWDYAAGGLAKLFGADDWAEQQIANDWVNYNHADEWFNPSEGWQFVGDVAGGIGTSLPAIAGVAAAGAITVASGGTLSPVAATLIAGSIAGLGAAGRATKEAYDQTGELTGKEFGYGALSGFTEGAMEGVSTALGAGIGSVTKSIAKSFGKEVAKSATRNTLLKGVVKGFAGEAFEEGVQAILDPVYKRMTYDPNAKNATFQEVAYAALVGGLSGAIMGGGDVAVRNIRGTVRGNTLVNEGKSGDVITTAEQISSYQTENQTDYETFQVVQNTLDELKTSLQKTDGEVRTVRQKMLLGVLEQANTSAAFEPIVTASAENIYNNAETVAARLNELGYQDQNGKPIQVTAEQIREGIDTTDAKKFRKTMSRALKTNSVLRTLAVADTVGQISMDTARFRDATLAGQQLSTQADLNRFVEQATDAERQAVADRLGIENWETLTNEQFHDKITEFVANGGVQEYQQERSYVKEAQAVAPEAARKHLPRMVNLRNDGTYRYTQGGTDIAITKRGDSYYVYDYESGLMSKALSRTETNRVLREIHTNEQNYQNGVRQHTEAQNRLREQAAEIDTYARENISEYKNLSAAGQAAIRATIRQGRAAGVQEDFVLSCARVSARSGLRVVFSKEASFVAANSTYADGAIDLKNNRIIINPEAKSRSGESVLIHELTHAIYNDTDGTLTVAEGLETMTDAEKEKIRKRYAAVGQGSAVQVSDEVNAHFAEQTLSNRNILERLVQKKQTLKEKILGFFKKARTDYQSDEKLTGAAARLYRQYKKLFDEFSARNQRYLGVENASAEAEVQAGNSRFALSKAFERLGKYTDSEVASIEATKHFRVARSYSDVRQFIADAQNENTQKRLFLGKVTPETAAKIYQETGINAEGKGIALSGDDVRHIFARHGVNGSALHQGDIAVTQENFENIIETLIDPDSVSRTDQNGTRGILFQKEIGGRVTAITLVSEKKKALTLKSAWITKSGGRTPSASADTLAGTSETNGRSSTKRKQATSPSSNAEALNSTSETLPRIKPVSTDSISQNAENVNSESQKGKKFALPDTDSDGGTLNAEQREFFGKSAIVDADGKLLKMYHGTAADFTVFDLAESGASNDHTSHIGFWFTPRKAVAENFAEFNANEYRGKRARVQEVYLNIENPKIYAPADNSARMEELRTENIGLREQLAEEYAELKETVGRLNYMLYFTEDNIFSRRGENDIGYRVDEDYYVQYMKMSPEQAKKAKSLVDAIKKNNKQIKANETEYYRLQDGDSFLQMSDDLDEFMEWITGTHAHERGFGREHYAATNAREAAEKFRSKLIKEGYDGIWIKDTRVDDSGDQVVAFYPEQIKLVTNKRPTKDVDIRYALALDGETVSGAVEETNDLVALHNLTEENLLKVLDLGGFPMPSIAVTKADIPFTDFGDITVVFGKETIDPAKPENAVYSRDAWTPTVPQAEYEINETKAREIIDRLLPYVNEFGDIGGIRKRLTVDELQELANNRDGNIVDEFAGSIETKYAYLREIGAINKDDTDMVPAYSERLRGKINSEISARNKEYKAWIDELFNGIIAKKGIRTRTDRFTSSGASRSFDETHIDYTLENIVKFMRSSPTQSAETTYASTHTLAAALAKNFSSIEDIKSAKAMLSAKAESEIAEARNRYESSISEIIDSMAGRNIELQEGAEEVLLELARSHRTTPTSILGYLEKEYRDFYNFNAGTAQKISTLFNALAAMKTDMFEAKPRRAVGLNEIKRVLIPSRHPNQRLLEALTEKNIPYTLYERSIDKGIDERADILQRLDGVRFALPKTDSAGESLSQGQREYFKDSKVVDDNGKLRITYHGSPNRFFTFDRGRIGKGNDQFGAGFYFATSEEASRSYGDNVHKTYLNITKPIVINRTADGGDLFDVKITQKQAYEILKRHPLIYDPESSPLGDMFEEYWEVGAKDYMIREAAKNFNSIGLLDSDFLAYRDYPNELHEAIRDVLGYDGVEVRFDNTGDRFYVAWFENQIKLTTNKQPTRDADIRFALSDSVVNVDSANETAAWTSERVTDLIDRYGATNPRYTQAYATWINPADFVKATTVNQTRRNQIYDEAGNLDIDALSRETQTPYLTVDYETMRIVGHEGRHRMAALAKAGVKRVAVAIRFTENSLSRYDARIMDGEHKLKGQTFSSWDADAQRVRTRTSHNSAAVGTLVPINAAYSAQLSEFTSERGVRFALDSSEEGDAQPRGNYSVGQRARFAANNTGMRVYTKAEAAEVINSIIEERLVFEEIGMQGELRGKDRQAVIDYLFQKLNTVKEGYRGGVALRIADFMIEHTVLTDMYADSNGEVSEAMRRLSVLRRYMHKIDLRHIQGEIQYRFDKKNSINLVWGAKEGGIAPDTLPQLLADEGIFIDAINEADCFLQMVEMYEDARAAVNNATESVMLSTYGDARTIKDLRQQIARDVLNAYEQKGRKSKYAKLVEKYTKQIAELKQRLREANANNRLINSIVDQAQKMRDLKLGTFLNSTQYKSDVFKSSIEALGKIKFRGNFNIAGTRKIMADLRTWYTKENPLLADTYEEGIADMLDTVANGTKGYTKDELRMINNLMAYFTNYVEHFNKVYRQGRWVDAVPEATRYIDILHRNEELKSSWFMRKVGTAYLQTFGDPMSVMRRMDRYESGFYTEIFTELRDSKIDAEIAKMQLMEEYGAFLKKNKKYLAQATKETVEYRGVEIPRMQLISLYMTLKRQHAQAGLAENGFGFWNAQDQRVRIDGFAKGITEESELRAAAVEEQARIAELLTETDKEYIAILEKGYQEAGRLKADRDIQRLGFTNATEDYYYPIRRGNIAKNVDSAEMQQELDRISNASFNKDTVRGAKQELYIESADAVFNRHVRGVVQYAYISPAIETYNKLFNLDIAGNPNKPVSVSTESANVWKQGNDYFKKLITDIQGISPVSSEGRAVLSFIRGSYAKFQLGANPKVWVTQLSSLFASSSILDASSITRGMFVSSKDIDTYCPLAKLRAQDNTAAMAQGLFDKVGRVSNALMAPIGKMDRFVVRRLFGACQVQVQKDGGAKIGTEANKIEAGKLLKRVILETQQNSLATERSAAMRSGNEIMRTLTMFSADSMKVIGRVIDSVGELSALKAKLRTTTDTDSRAALQTQIKAARRNVRKSLTALATSALFMAAIAQLFSWLYNKDSDDDETAAQQVLVDFAGNLLGGLPLVRDIYSRIMEGYSVDNYAYSALNDLLDSTVNLFDTVGSLVSGEESKSKLTARTKNLLYALGQLTGIPTRNIYNVFYGLTKRISPTTAYQIDEAFYAKNYVTDLNKAIESDDTDMIAMLMSMIFGERMGNTTMSDAVRDKFVDLYSKGYSVLPRSIGDTISYGGVEIPLTDEEYARFRAIYVQSMKDIEKMMNGGAFKVLSEEMQAEAIKQVYDAYYYDALSDLVGVDERTTIGELSKWIDMSKLSVAFVGLSDIESEKNSKGETIAGSKKKNTVKYLLGQNLSDGERLLILCYRGYTIQDGDYKGYTAKRAKRILLQYILKLNGTQAEKAALAEKCGFTVRNGRIIRDF